MPTVKSRQYDALRGGWLEVGTFSLFPASAGGITAQGETETTADSAFIAAPGDLLFVAAQTLAPGLFVKGSRVSATGAVLVTLGNISAGTITSSTSAVFGYELFHYTTTGS